MSDLEAVFRYSKKIESALESVFGAEGRGLHEKVTSIEGDLPTEIAKKIRFIASVRNKLAHEEGYELESHDVFSAGDEVLAFVNSYSDRRMATDSVGFEVRVRRVLGYLFWPSVIVFSVLGLWAGLETGIGAGIVWGIWSGLFGAALFCKRAIDFYIQAFYWSLAILVVGSFIAGIVFLWDVGSLA
ncbi:hypothetical protein [Thioalkalivibrio sp. ALJ9]|uniref:hypothetical protein n=1 Tax=Thioalkalivibrio sp. ALJ9 TaxID=1158758 RepID=UPI0003722ED8|nr:hypothetical protein [Thioalkalivibrio sp. ALJ9]